MYILPEIVERKDTKYHGIYQIKASLVEEEENEDLILKEIPCSQLYFLSEAMVSYRFSSPYLNKAKYCGISEKYCQLFYEQAEGTCLSVPINVQNTMNSIVLGVMHLHQRRIIHGDIKGHNVLIFNGEAKLSDFGLSCFILEGQKQTFRSSVKMYTSTHRPPEVWKTNTWGFAADIWSLGCTFFEIIYGYSLFPMQVSEKDYLECLDDYINHRFAFTEGKNYKKIRFPKKWHSSSSHYVALNNLIKSMLQSDPELRPTVFDVANWLSISNEELKVSSSVSMVSSPLMSPITSVASSPSSFFPYQHKFYSISLIHEPLQSKLRQKIIHFTQSSNSVLIDLISCLYESISLCSSINLLYLKCSILIIYMIVYQSYPPFYTVTDEEINEIYEISKKINFNYINWIRMYHLPP